MRDDPAGHRHEVRDRGADDERVEELVEAEPARADVRSLESVDDRAARVD